MSEKRAQIRVNTGGPPYLGWRGELLAELALARVEELAVLKRPRDATADFPFDFVVTAPGGMCFFIEVKAFSSMRLNCNPRDIHDWQFKTDAAVVRNARKSLNPVVALLFDADSDYGRFLRLDTLAEPPDGEESVLLTFPIENTITPDSIRNLTTEMERSRLMPAG